MLDRVAREAGVVRGWVNNACRSEAYLLGYLNLKSIKPTLESTFYDVMLAGEAAADRMKGEGGERGPLGEPSLPFEVSG